MLGGINLPDDATLTDLNGNECIVWRSLKLKALIGDEYAAGTTTTGTDTAYLVAETSPHC